MDQRAVEVVVSGRVQGVWFRASARDVARAAGVRGWVRNRPDGAVAAHLEGPPEAVEQVLTWMRAGGPPSATVDQVSVRDVVAIRPLDFDVR